MIEKDFDIDFIIPWVDGSDPKWITEFNKYAPKQKRIDLDVSSERYRDYGLLRYWFRGVEKFAPWVHKVHFVTCGQKPDWLNLEAPKLNWVKHKDYICAEYLPVFSANPIELGMRAINGLSEKFVYFNDDFFLTAPINKNFFFKKGLPNDCFVLNPITPGGIGHIVMNDLQLLNTKVDKNTVIKENFAKFFNFKYGRLLLRTFTLIAFPTFRGFYDPHFAQPYLKSVLNDCWKNNSSELEQTMANRFRSNEDINQYLFRYWQLCKGKFHPENPKRQKKYFTIGQSDLICEAILKRKYKEIVINDESVDDYDKKINDIKNAFEKILPNKSSFEK